MRKAIIFLGTIIFSSILLAQSPDKMSYQAVVRDLSNSLVRNQSVGIQISILQGSVNGTSVYVETQNVSTNINGLVSLIIGDGIIVSGDFTTINWLNGPFFIKTETDPQGGTNYSITGTSQLLSVPYALHANTAQSILDTSIHKIGDIYQGGIVFWVTADGYNGLIASLDDLDGGSGISWSNITNVAVGASSQSMTDGVSNTSSIIAQSGHTGSAAKICDDYTGGGYTDWYLPSNRELYLLCAQDFVIDNILDNDGDPNTNGFRQEYIAPTFSRYWSSSEDDSDYSWAYFFYFGRSGNSLKFNTYRVRAIRTF